MIETSPLDGLFTPVTGSSNRSTLDQNAFMNLLVTQLRNQDPLSPLQPHEFAAQLAEFTGVEQLTQIKAGMDQQLQSLQLATIMNQTAFSASLLGKELLAVGNQVQVVDGEQAEVQIDVEIPGGQGTLIVRDKDGDEVAEVDLGHLDAGRQSLDLPEDLAGGVYTYEVKVEDDTGVKVPVTQFVSGFVDHVQFEGGLIVLRIGEIEITLDSIVEISSPSSGD